MECVITKVLPLRFPITLIYEFADLRTIHPPSMLSKAKEIWKEGGQQALLKFFESEIFSASASTKLHLAHSCKSDMSTMIERASGQNTDSSTDGMRFTPINVEPTFSEK